MLPWQGIWCLPNLDPEPKLMNITRPWIETPPKPIDK